MTSGGLAAVSSSFFAALYSAFGRYDVVHIHAEGPAFFTWLPKMFGKRVVVTVHGIDWQREKWQSGLGSKFIHQGEKNAAKYADEVIVLSKGVQGYFKETYGSSELFPEDEVQIIDYVNVKHYIINAGGWFRFYKNSSETRNEIFNKAFNYLKGRLWIPAQVYFEYLKNKSKVSEKPILSYERLLTKQSKDGGYVNSIVDKTKMLQGQSLGEIKNQLKTLKEQTLGTDKHPYLSPDVYAEYESVLSVVENQLTDFSTKTAEFQTRIQKEIEKKITELQSNLLPDNVNNAIESSFQIGKEYSFSKMMEIAREGSFRYSEEIPPGYEDGKEKTGLQKYGDLFVWNQILDCAKSKQKDFIFVTNDVKIDWYEEDKRTPRFELLKEFREQANKRIWLLSMKNFIYHVNLLLDDQIHENVLQDIDSVQDEKENDKIRKELSADDIQKIFNNLIVKPIYVIDKIPKNESIRLFDNPDIYEAEDENGRKFRIITTIVGGGNYARVLHGMTNAFELKKLYETGNEHYWYYNFIIAKNEALVEKVMEHMGKTKVRKLFADHSIQTAVCYSL